MLSSIGREQPHVSLKQSVSAYGDVLEGLNVKVPHLARHFEEQLPRIKASAG